jgi:hypothetical protein
VAVIFLLFAIQITTVTETLKQLSFIRFDIMGNSRVVIRTRDYAREMLSNEREGGHVLIKV